MIWLHKMLGVWWVADVWQNRPCMDVKKDDKQKRQKDLWSGWKRNKNKNTGTSYHAQSPHSITLCKASDVTLLCMLLAYTAVESNADKVSNSDIKHVAGMYDINAACYIVSLFFSCSMILHWSLSWGMSHMLLAYMTYTLHDDMWRSMLLAYCCTHHIRVSRC